jgi:hypothetical protein
MDLKRDSEGRRSKTWIPHHSQVREEDGRGRGKKKKNRGRKTKRDATGSMKEKA